MPLLLDRRERAAADQVAGLLGDHDRRAVGVAAGHVGHHRGVDHAQGRRCRARAARDRPRGRSRKCRPGAGWSPAVARMWASISSSVWTSAPGTRLARDQAGHRLGARRSCARAAGPARAVAKSASLSNRLSWIAGRSRGSARLERDPAARLRVEQDHVGAERVLGALHEARKPQVRGELHRVREQLDVGLGEPRVGAQHRVGAVELARERAGAEQVPLRHRARGAVEAQLVDEGDRALGRELERDARMLGEVAADAGEVVDHRDAASRRGARPGRCPRASAAAASCRCRPRGSSRPRGRCGLRRRLRIRRRSRGRPRPAPCGSARWSRPPGSAAASPA